MVGVLSVSTDIQHTAFGRTGLCLPPIVFGTSCLGNLYEVIADEVKLSICREWFRHASPLSAGESPRRPVALDSAGKYGAGLALEQLGRCLRALEIPPEQVIISNKLGWKRTPLKGPSPTFEPGVWADIGHDAELRVSYQGILDCWEEGLELLGPEHAPQMVSVHDPDEYLAAAASPAQRSERFGQILDAYRALNELKATGAVRAVGVGAKDWCVVRELHQAVGLDWVMFANSLTVLHHPPELLAFVDQLRHEGVGVINSAVFHAGFLVGGRFFDYRVLSHDTAEHRRLFVWRETFQSLCERHRVSPAAACVRFALSPPGVAAVALNTSRPERVAENVAAVQAEIPAAFWVEAKDIGLIRRDYPYVGC